MTVRHGWRSAPAAPRAAMAGLAASAGLLLAGCAAVQEAQRAQAFPPPRVLFASLGPEDQVRHGEAVVAALDGSAEQVARPWSGATAGVSGSVTVLGTYRHSSGLVCRRLRDTLRMGERSETATDLACWSGAAWVWARDDGAEHAVVPAAATPSAPEPRSYTVRSGGSLADVARVTGAPLDTLRTLNPELPARLPPGTRVRLP